MECMEKCPFCKSDDLGIDSNSESLFWVVCQDCGAEGPPGKSKEHAREMWDIRA